MGWSGPCQSEARAESRRVGPRKLCSPSANPRERNTRPAAGAGLCGYQAATVTGMETLRSECFTPQEAMYSCILPKYFLIDCLAAETRGVWVPRAAVRRGRERTWCGAARSTSRPRSEWQPLSGSPRLASYSVDGQ